MIKVHIFEGRDLPAADVIGSSDPYCVVWLNDDEENSVKTNIIKKTLNPKWDREFIFSEHRIQIPADEWNKVIININVLDWNRLGKHDFLGKVTIPLNNIVEDWKKPEYYSLEKCNYDSHGTLVVSVHYITPLYLKLQPQFQFGKDITSLPTIRVKDYSAEIPKILVTMKAYLINNDGLYSEGIFRKAPNKINLHSTKLEFNKNIFQHCKNIHIIAALIKMWFRDLPNPIFAKNGLIEKVIEHSTYSVENAKAVLDTIQDPNRSILEWLLDLCSEVYVLTDYNRMTPKALAVVFAPNLIPQCDDPQRSLLFTSKTEQFMIRAIEYRRSIKPPPSPMPPKKTVQKSLSSTTLTTATTTTTTTTTTTAITTTTTTATTPPQSTQLKQSPSRMSRVSQMSIEYESRRSITLGCEKEIQFQGGKLGMNCSKNFVVSVNEGGQAHLAGVKPGWRIKDINKKDVDHNDKITKLIQNNLEKNENILITFITSKEISKSSNDESSTVYVILSHQYHKGFVCSRFFGEEEWRERWKHSSSMYSSVLFKTVDNGRIWKAIKSKGTYAEKIKQRPDILKELWDPNF